MVIVSLKLPFVAVSWVCVGAVDGDAAGVEVGVGNEAAVGFVVAGSVAVGEGSGCVLEVAPLSGDLIRAKPKPNMDRITIVAMIAAAFALFVVIVSTLFFSFATKAVNKKCYKRIKRNAWGLSPTEKPECQNSAKLYNA
jgi:hypothetical protein